MQIFFIGLGQMGRRMAARLDREETTVWNRSRAILEEFEQKGYQVAPDVETGTRNASIVITMLRDQDAVREVGERGLFRGLHQGQLWIDMTTGGPREAELFHALAASQGAGFVAAPVLGTLGPARDGTLTVLTGGTQGDVDRAQPILERFGRVHRLDSPRQALVMKLVVNTLLAFYMDAVSECLPLLDDEGIGRGQALEILMSSSVAAPVMKGKAARWKDGHYGDPEFPIALLSKDLDLMTALAADRGWDLPGIVALQGLFREASRQKPYQSWDMAGIGEALARRLQDKFRHPS